MTNIKPYLILNLFLIVGLVMFVKCDFGSKYIDKDLQQYIDIYKEEVEKRNAVDLSGNLMVLDWEVLPDSIRGLGRKGEILINEGLKGDSLVVEYVFMHEVGHALYGLHHSDCKDVAIMCLPAAWIYHKNRKELLDELIKIHDQGSN